MTLTSGPPQRRLKLEYVITGLEVGGAETVVCDVATGMSARGHAVGVTTLIAPGPLADRLRGAGISITSLALPRGAAGASGLPRAALKLRRQIIAAQPEIVHGHMVHANLLARAALLGTGRKLICTVHNTSEGGWHRDLGYRLTNWASALTTTISQAATRRFVAQKILPPTTLTVYNGVDFERFSPVVTSSGDTAGRFRWLAVGRLTEQKDYPTLFAAMAKLPGHDLSIAGDGEDRARLATLAQTLGIADRVHFLGNQPDVVALLRAHQGYVLSSAWEGFGISLVEAMGCALPVVATRSGGPEEIVGIDGRAGLLVPTRDPQALADAMAVVAAMPTSARSQMGLRARQRVVGQFSLPQILDTWESIYWTVASGGRPRDDD